MSIEKTAQKPQSPDSAELTCDHCHRAAPRTFKMATGRVCGVCAQALKFSQIVDELSDRYNYIFESKPEQDSPR